LTALEKGGSGACGSRAFARHFTKTLGVSSVDGKLMRSQETGRCLTPSTRMVLTRSALGQRSGFRLRFDTPSPSSFSLRVQTVGRNRANHLAPDGCAKSLFGLDPGLGL